MGTKEAVARPVDRLPRQIHPEWFYLNVDPSSPPRDPDDTPEGMVAVVIYDGANDWEAVVELAGRCVEDDYVVLMLTHANLDHIDRDRDDVMLGLSRRQAYRREGDRWVPTPKLVRAMQRQVADDRCTMVIVDDARG